MFNTFKLISMSEKNNPCRRKKFCFQIMMSFVKANKVTKYKIHTNSQTRRWQCDGLGLLGCFRTRMICGYPCSYEFCSHWNTFKDNISWIAQKKEVILEWSSQSLDLNLIEMLWDYAKHGVKGSLPVFTNSY